MLGEQNSVESFSSITLIWPSLCYTAYYNVILVSKDFATPSMYHLLSWSCFKPALFLRRNEKLLLKVLRIIVMVFYEPITTPKCFLSCITSLPSLKVTLTTCCEVENPISDYGLVDVKKSKYWYLYMRGHCMCVIQFKNILLSWFQNYYLPHFLI